MTKNRRDPEKMIRAEREHIASLGDEAALKLYWEKRYHETYESLLAGRSEYGRYGVVAEYLLRTLPGGSVLDIGCGPGILAGLLQHSTLSYTGLDISDEAIRLAKARFPEMREHFHTASYETFRSEERYDAVVASEILYYIDAELFLRNCGRLLRHGGHLVVTVYDFEEGRRLLPLVTSRMKDPFRAEVYNAGKELRWHIVAGVFSA
jgi:2-polyprenyl-3-methyl-5-hydroxy-6-metoxy-1,4-benzoquinol methylase